MTPEQLEKRRASQKAHYWRHIEKQRARHREKYHLKESGMSDEEKESRDKKKRKQYNEVYRPNNIEKIREKDSAYYLKNKNTIIDRQKKLRIKRPDYYREIANKSASKQKYGEFSQAHRELLELERFIRIKIL